MVSMLLSFPKVTIDGQELETRDGLGIWDVNAQQLKLIQTQFFDGNTNAILILG
jgi:hypothetical protein